MRPFSFRGDRFPADEFCYAVWMLRVQPQFPGRRDAAGTAEAGQPGPVPRLASAEDSGQLIAHWPGQNSTDRQQAGLASFRGRLAVDRGGAVSPTTTCLRPARQTTWSGQPVVTVDQGPRDCVLKNSQTRSAPSKDRMGLLVPRTWLVPGQPCPPVRSTTEIVTAPSGVGP